MHSGAVGGEARARLRDERALVVGTALIALAVRLAMVRRLPYASGDWVLYGNVAGAILRGCGVAVQLPGSGRCVPHFGGNQLPLFPAFAAANWWLFAHSDLAIRVTQSAVAAVAMAWLARAVLRLTGRPAAGAAAGLLLAVSPVQAVWAGALLTETLACASTAWVLAELLLGVAERRVRVVPLGLALAAAAWVRMDGVLLIPVAGAASLLAERRVGRAAGRFALAVAIVAAPCLAWGARNLAAGLPMLPQPDVRPDGSYLQGGYVRWCKSWMVGQKERGDAGYFDIRDPHYRLSSHAWDSPAEAHEVLALIAAVRATPGTGIPPREDAAFARLAAAREAARSPGERVLLFGRRAWALSARWLWPWAGDIGDGRTRASASDWYRFALLLLAGAGGALGAARRRRALWIAAALLAGFGALRVAFFAAEVGIELRYLTEIAPFAEAAAGIGAALLLEAATRKRRAGRSA